jgi:hypothetical protein
MERLAEKMKRSRAQEASITKKIAERQQTRDRQPTAERKQGAEHQKTAQREPERERATERTRPHEYDIDDFLDPRRERPHDRSDDDDFVSRDQPDEAHHDRVQEDARERFTQHQHETEPRSGPVNIQDANPADIDVEVRDLGDIELAYSTQLYDLEAHTGEPTYVLFGGWQTEQQLGFVATVHAHGETDVHMSTEDRDGRDIETELHDRIGQIIERSQVQETTNARDPDRDHHREPTQLEAGERTLDQEPAIEPLEQDPRLQPEPEPVQHDPQLQPEPEREREPVERDPQLQPERERVERDPYIQEAIDRERDRQQAFEQDISRDRDNDRDMGFGIE